MASESFADRLGQLIGEAKNRNSFAAKCGVSDSLLRKYLAGGTPGIDKAAQIADAAGVSLEWLVSGRGEKHPPPSIEPRPAEPAPTSGGEPPPTFHGFQPIGAVDLDAVRQAMPLDLPVYGTAAGSLAVHHEGAFELENRVVEYVRRPPALMSVRDAYAIYVEGSSMVPEHRPGDLRFIHPHKPARAGDSVVVQARYGEHLGVEAFIAHLVRRNADKLVVAKLSPVANVTFETRYVSAVHRVLSLNELFGL